MAASANKAIISFLKTFFQSNRLLQFTLKFILTERPRRPTKETYGHGHSIVFVLAISRCYEAVFLSYNVAYWFKWTLI